MNIILASKSQQRAAILSQLNIPYKIIISDIKEKVEANCPKELALHNAEIKALHVAKDYPLDLVIGADTIVVCENKIFGKPENLKQTEEFFNFFSGKKIEVYSGLALILGNKKALAVDQSFINVRKVDKKFIHACLAHTNPLHKAGGFTMESIAAIMFDQIQGSYFNILGLPIHLLYDLFFQLDLNLMDFVKK